MSNRTSPQQNTACTAGATATRQADAQSATRTKALRGAGLLLAAAAVLGLAGCDRATELYTQATTTPEQRMAGATCGAVPQQGAAVLGIAVGMPLAQAQALLRCYDGKAHVQIGTRGQLAGDASKFLRERSAGQTAYGNLLIWTRGTPRPCAAGGATDGSVIAESLRPDDQRYAPWVYSGTTVPGFDCFSRVQDQVTLLADGAPGRQVVTAVWRLHVPADGKRPSLDGTLDSLAARYPVLDTSNARRTAAGFAVEGYADTSGRALQGAQIRSDAINLTQPTVPAPLKTTERCGWFFLDVCERVPTAQERADFAAATQRYNQQLQVYKERRPLVDAFHACVLQAPSAPGNRTVQLEEGSNCGLAYYAAAKSYPGGFAEAYFVGIYSHAQGKGGAQQLAEYLKQYRTAGAETSNKPSL